MKSVRQPLMIILVAALAVIGAALASHYWGGLQPCELCLMERWPYYAAIVLAVLALAFPVAGWSRAVLLLLAAVFVISAGLGFYHVGVEYHWFRGPTACTNNGGVPQTLEQLKQMLAHTQAVMCDQVQWSLGGISLAGWNFIASALIAVFAFSAWRHHA
ncbi:MAG: disulfide bond formation protein B [Alphaproteobacteria bacterium]|nr:disulfide bond formation protein B [Alphaproteobacteria bacterium]